MKITWPVCMLLINLFAAATCAAEPIYIGLSLPLTGANEGYGQAMKHGVELAAQEINAAGGINGRQLAFVVEDSQSDSMFAQKIALKLTKNEKVVAEIGDFTSSCCLSAQPVYRKAKMVQLSPSSSHPAFPPGSPYSFGIHGTQAEQGPVMAHLAVTTLKKKRLAILSLNTDWGVVAKKYFADAAVQLGAEIVAEATCLQGATDFAATLQTLRAAQPDLLYLGLLYQEAALVLQQIQASGWRYVVVMGSRALTTPELLELAGSAAEGLYLSATFLPANPAPEVQEFVRRYQAQFNTLPSQYAALGYDALNMLAVAIRTAGPERQAIRDALAAIRDFHGVTGTISFTETGGVTKKHLFVQVRQGKFVKLDGQ